MRRTDSYRLLRYSPGWVTIGDGRRRHVRLTSEGIAAQDAAHDGERFRWSEIETATLDLPMARTRIGSRARDLLALAVTALSGEIPELDPPEDGHLLVHVRDASVQIPVSIDRPRDHRDSEVRDAQTLLDVMLEEPSRRNLFGDPVGLQRLVAEASRGRREDRPRHGDGPLDGGF